MQRETRGSRVEKREDKPSLSCRLDKGCEGKEEITSDINSCIW